MLKSHHEQRAKCIEDFIKKIASTSSCSTSTLPAEESGGIAVPKSCAPVKSLEAVPSRPKINQKLIRTKADICFIKGMNNVFLLSLFGLTRQGMEQRNEERIARKKIMEELKHQKKLELIVRRVLLNLNSNNFCVGEAGG